MVPPEASACMLWGGIHRGTKVPLTITLSRYERLFAFANIACCVIMSFESLPDEVLPGIFSCVSPGTLLKLSLVSENNCIHTSRMNKHVHA